MSLAILQINVQKSKVATTELRQRNFDIALVQEPYLQFGRASYFDTINYSVHYFGKGARALVLVKKGINFWPVEDLTDEDTATIALTVNRKTVYLSSVYLDILDDVCSPGLTRLSHVAQSSHIPFIASIDSNAHSPLWESDEVNPRGQELSDYLMTNHLHVLNRGTIKTFSTNRSQTIIDITIANSKALDLLLNDWHVDMTVCSLSDHNYIRFSLGGYVPHKETFRNFKKADWGKFCPSVSITPFHELLSSKQIDEKANEFYECISREFDHVCPLKPALQRRPNRWWNADLDTARNALRAALKSVRRDGHTSLVKTPLYQVRYKRYKRLIKEAKRDSWRKFCSEAETAKDVADLVRILDGKKGQRNISLLKTARFSAKTPEESLGILLNTHFPSSVPFNEDESDFSELSHMEEGKTDLIEYINDHKTKEALLSFGSFKAPGPDDVRPVALKHLDSGSLKALVELYRAVINTGYTPLSWRQMNVVFLAKPGKPDYSVPKAYRPITLSNFMLKGLERLVQWYIQENFIKDPLPNQHAYTSRLGTDTALSTFVDALESMLLRKRKVLVVSLDCSGAFDTISFLSARLAMERLLIPPCLIRWYDGILRNRSVTANLQGCETSIRPGKGSPQGGVLSPIIWNFIIDDLLSRYGKTSPVKAVGYADDVLLYVKGNDTETMRSLMQDALDEVLNWGNSHGLSYNPEKTTILMFENGRKYKSEPILKMAGVALEYSQNLKYLGVTINKRLSWLPHVRERVAKCNALLNKVRHIIADQWGLTKERILWIHNAIVLPRLSYGAIVWANNLSQTMVQLMDSVQRRTLLSLTRALRSTPTRGLEVVTGIPPIWVHLQEMAARAWLRIRNLSAIHITWDGNGDSRSGHRTFWNRILDKIPETSSTNDMEAYDFNWWTPLTLPAGNSELVIFTDGSGADGKSGWGWVATSGDYIVAENHGSLGKATVFSAEVMAIAKSALWLTSTYDGPARRIAFYTDCQAAKQSLCSRQISSALVLETTRALIKAKENGFQISVDWVRSHSNNTGNEYADSLAKLGLSSPEVSQVGISPSEIKRAIRQHFDLIWQGAWSSRGDCSHTKKMLPTVDRSRRKTLLGLGAQETQKLVAAITGHGLWRYHLGKFHNLDKTCQLCNTDSPETPFHLWHECEATSRLRASMHLEKNLTSINSFFSERQIDRIWQNNAAELTLLKEASCLNF